MVIQSYVMYKKIKYTKSFNYVLNQMLTWPNEQGSQIRYKYRGQFMLIAAV